MPHKCVYQSGGRSLRSWPGEVDSGLPGPRSFGALCFAKCPKMLSCIFAELFSFEFLRESFWKHCALGSRCLRSWPGEVDSGLPGPRPFGALCFAKCPKMLSCIFAELFSFEFLRESFWKHCALVSANLTTHLCYNVSSCILLFF